MDLLFQRTSKNAETEITIKHAKLYFDWVKTRLTLAIQTTVMCLRKNKIDVLACIKNIRAELQVHSIKKRKQKTKAKEKWFDFKNSVLSLGNQ